MILLSKKAIAASGKAIAHSEITGLDQQVSEIYVRNETGLSKVKVEGPE